MNGQLITYCSLNGDQLNLNGETLHRNNEHLELAPFLGSLYKQLDLGYPKFFKMDKLCKLALLASELVIRQSPELKEIPKEAVALVFSNEASSLDTDRQHQQSINDKQQYFPSPSVFVYTLPNILMGEIAIKHKFTGENAFFVSEKFEATLMHSYTELLLTTTATQAVIAGWVNVDENAADAFVYCVKKANFSGENQAHTPQTLQHLYNTRYGSTGNSPKT